MINIPKRFGVELMFKLKAINIKLIIALLPVSLIISSCDRADLDAAEKYGLMAAEFQDSTSKLANDIYDSCVRKTKFYPMNFADSQTLQREEIEKCDSLYKPVAGKAQIANQVIVDYMTAVGQLASDNSVNFNKSLANIGTALKSLAIPTKNTPVTLNSTEVDAGINIVGFFLNLAKQDFQRDNLKEAILCTNEPVQTYSKGLTSVFQDGYIGGILKLEQDRVVDYYQSYASLIKDEEGKVDDFITLEKEYASALDSVLEKRNAALSYITIINKTAEKHGQLKAIFTKDDRPVAEEQLKATCQKYFARKEEQPTSSNSFQDTEENKQISDAQIKKVRALALQYASDIEPLIKEVNKAF
jgi:hypothetical protein